ncbi:MAG: hypothetical protein ACSLFB_11980 [Acidimicrobiales bacterium]
MYPHWNLVICTAALSLLAGCEDPLDANKTNFQKVLQSYNDAHPVCASISFKLPIEFRSDSDAARKQQLEPLVRAGLISVETIQKNESAAPVQARAADYLRYAPTSEGENVIRKGVNSFLGGTDICFARRKVVNIESFTEPIETMGMMVSRVTYEYEMSNVEAWAKTPEIVTAFPQIEVMLAKSDHQATDVLVQTKRGWKHERDVH